MTQGAIVIVDGGDFWGAGVKKKSDLDRGMNMFTPCSPVLVFLTEQQVATANNDIITADTTVFPHRWSQDDSDHAHAFRSTF